MTLRALAILAASVAITLLVLVRSPGVSEVRFPMPASKVYVQECGSCHTAYAPGLLPARAWRKMMSELADHFGEDASLADPHYFAILKELETLAADGSHADMRMRRIQAAIPAGESPQRISQTRYFKALHDEVPVKIWRRKGVGAAANCLACHIRANEGRYSESEVRVPEK